MCCRCSTQVSKEACSALVCSTTHAAQFCVNISYHVRVCEAVAHTHAGSQAKCVQHAVCCLQNKVVALQKAVQNKNSNMISIWAMLLG